MPGLVGARIVTSGIGRVDAIAQGRAQEGDDVGVLAHGKRRCRLRSAHANRRRPARTPAVTATAAKIRPTQVSPMLHQATVAET